MQFVKTVVLGITSGIAAYKSLDLIHELRKENIDVFVVMTANALKMISRSDFEEASGHKVYAELFKKGFNYKTVLRRRKVDHIELADKADILVIAPATANIIAKLAHGISDDFLTTTSLAVTVPVIVCPSMNVNMWHNPVVQENVNKLKQQGYIIIEPSKGMLACGYEGVGRLTDIDVIKEEVLESLNYANSLRGKNIIVTAGATAEKIDEVRYITNRSSGKMGAAIAEEYYLRGANVLLLRAKNSVKPRYLIKEKQFITARDLLLLIKKYVKDYQYFYHSAAVSDFSVKNQYKGKLSSKKQHSIILVPQVKILDRIKRLNPIIKLIAFKAEYVSNEKKLVNLALNRLRESSADAIVANDISRGDRGFEVDHNEAYIVLPDGSNKHLSLSSKREIARGIVDYVEHSLRI
jgi:phosphopantothenoylcysteine decarboxylase / phosphopantothenate---cysteine ligase